MFKSFFITKTFMYSMPTQKLTFKINDPLLK